MKLVSRGRRGTRRSLGLDYLGTMAQSGLTDAGLTAAPADPPASAGRSDAR